MHHDKIAQLLVPEDVDTIQLYDTLQSQCKHCLETNETDILLTVQVLAVNQCETGCHKSVLAMGVHEVCSHIEFVTLYAMPTEEIAKLQEDREQKTKVFERHLVN